MKTMVNQVSREPLSMVDTDEKAVGWQLRG